MSERILLNKQRSSSAINDNTSRRTADSRNEWRVGRDEIRNARMLRKVRCAGACNMSLLVTGMLMREGLKVS